jgi:hypothetical protein
MDFYLKFSTLFIQMNKLLVFLDHDKSKYFF